jgi:hypothetical protein
MVQRVCAALIAPDLWRRAAIAKQQFLFASGGDV